MFLASAPRDPFDHSGGNDTPDTHDQELIARVRGGDASALEEIFHRYWRGLLHFAQSLTRSRELAEEIVQDLFLALWAGRERWIITGSLKAYLFQSVRNRASKYRRDSRAEREAEADVPTELLRAIGAPFSSADASASVDDEALRAAVRAATAVLPERARQVFTLSREQHLSYSQIAAVLGISIKTVEMHMARALTELRKSLAAWR